MRKLILVMSFSFLLIITTACSSNAASGNGPGPADVPVQWVNAQIQNNQFKMLDILDKKTSALDPKKKSERKDTIKKYKLTEWKANDKDFFYKIEYQDPTDNDRLKTDQMEVIQTDNGWKRTKYGDISNFDQLVADLKPKVLRELHD